MTAHHPPREKQRVLLSWSSGKDAAWALHRLRQSDRYQVVGLLTTINREFARVAMHAVRQSLLERQARAAGLPLIPVPLPWPCTNAQYEAVIAQAHLSAQELLGITHIAYGDLFLEDVRAYREQSLAGTGLTPLFPLWGLPTNTLAREMISSGLRARLTCLDPRHLPPTLAGAAFDTELLAALPESVDPCGERGEFHTFAWDGPMFTHPLLVDVGEVQERDGFVFTDLISSETNPKNIHL